MPGSRNDPGRRAPTFKEKSDFLGRWWNDPQTYPDEFKSWLRSTLVQDPNIIWEKSQIPSLLGFVEAWHEVGATNEPAFQNGWVNHTVGTYETAGFFKDPFGIVHLKGLVRSGTASTAAFTLPVGYVPPIYSHFATVSNDLFGVVRILASGAVQLGPPGSNAYFSLAGITFRAA